MVESVLDRIREQVAELSPDEVAAQLVKLKEAREKQKAYRANQELSPEAREKRKEYNKERMQRPEVKQKMKEYRERPEVKEKQKIYRQERYAHQKALLERAKELGLEA
jgi:hypothetical protein